MDPINLGSGDNKSAQTVSIKQLDHMKTDDEDEKLSPRRDNSQSIEKSKIGQNNITAQMIEDNEAKLKERIAQCRNIIESLKIELNEEKSKLEKQSKPAQVRSIESPMKCTTSQYSATTDTFLEDITNATGMYSDCVDSKLSCDENLIEYEKQLQKYQNTLNMAQIEKKNAIRKQMLAKAYRLKLLEVENQCNIELLRVKQSLQCLEPLQLIASKWKTSSEDNMYDGNYELIPRYPELNAGSTCDMNNSSDALVPKETFENPDVLKDDCVSVEQAYQE